MTRIAIDPARPVGRLDRKVFGGFVEHLGRCIYGGLCEEGSPLSDDRGFRKDVRTRRTPRPPDGSRSTSRLLKQHAAEGLGQFPHVARGDVELDDRPEFRLPGLGIPEGRVRPS